MQTPNFSRFSAEDTDQMEKLTGIPAKAMLVQSGLLPSPPKGALVLDNACGGGVLTAVFFDAVGKTSDVRFVCGDLEESMVQSAAERITANAWNAEATVVDAMANPFPDNHFTHNLMNFGMQLIPDNELVLKESFRVLKPGGKVGMTSWTAPGWVPSFKIAVPTYAPPPALTNGPMSSKESITTLLAATGFTNIDVQVCKFDHQDHMPHFLAFMGTLCANVLVGETKERYEAYMRERFGGGEFTLSWEAFVITAEKP
ncbi:S-adenosyl-L-methionine-dependent methyltransferase [Mycena crocata]|nr:S-adenosyl-L-methionine-dependent methyltransferase [Mycena crocata]